MPGFELIGNEERQAVIDIFDKYGGVLFKHGFDKLRNGSFKVREFEDGFSEYIGSNFAQAVTSGTVALKVGLESLGVGPGDEVITQSFTFVATVEAIIECGATPVLTDIDETLNMDIGDLNNKVTKKTKVIIPVHMYGSAVDMNGVMFAAKKHNLLVLEDTAQALGGFYYGKELGTIGDIGTFSFDFGKALTTGEGGMVVTNNKELFLRAREYADHGHENNPNFPRGEDTRRRRGFNCRMMELQGAIGLAQLKKLPFAIKEQKKNKKLIKEAISGISKFKFRNFTDENGETADTLVLLFEDDLLASKFVRGIREQGLTTKNLPDAYNWHFAATWDHIFSELKGYYKRDSWKTLWGRSEKILKRAVALPIYIKMGEEMVSETIKTIKEVCRKI